MTIKIFIQHNPLFYGKVQWFFYLITAVRKIEFEFIPVKDEADLKVGNGDGFDIGVSTKFFDKVSLEMFDHSQYFDEELMVYDESNQKDIISTVFYLVNCIQEYHADKIYKDEYGRFRKEMSLQHKFSIVEENYVVNLIDQFIAKNGLPSGEKQALKVFISHDIDFLSSGFKQEFLYSIKGGKLGQAANFAKQRLQGDSPWNNIDDVIALDQSLDINATFYWLNYRERGKTGIPNADYDLTEEMLQNVSDAGMTNGLHTSATDYSIRKEVGDFPQEEVRHNRYHFLKFKLPYAWEELQKSKIKTDASLGFSRGMGFRNSFGLPFYPYNLKMEMPYRTLVIPLQIMDVGLKSHGSQDRHQVVKEVMTFIDKHREDSLISILFHNNELTPYSNQYMLQAYKDIIDILQEKNIDIIGIEDVISTYG